MNCFFQRIRALVMAVMCVCTASVAAGETLRIGGTGVALGGMRMLGDAFEDLNPNVSVEVLPSLGSSGGVKALMGGALDLSVISRALKDKEKATGATAQAYASTLLAVVTSLHTPDEEITTKELEDIYAGRTKYWPSGEQIRLILRPSSESDTQVLRGLSEEMAKSVDEALDRPGLVMATNDQDNAETIERLAGSLGLVALGQIATENRRLKVLRLDGVVAAIGNSQNGKFSKNLYIVRAPETTGLALRFLAYVLSDEGQAVLRSFDHAPAG